MNFSEDETKILLTILKQLTYTYKDASVVFPIIKKLESNVTEPLLTVPSNNVSGEAKVDTVVA